MSVHIGPRSKGSVLTQPPANAGLKMNVVISGCSRRKIAASGRVAAIDLYAGWCFPWLRGQLVRGRLNESQVFILSGLHGLIGARDKIARYDHKLTMADAVRMRRRVGAAFVRRVLRLSPTEVIVVAEPRYFALLSDVLGMDKRPRIRWFPTLVELPKAERIVASWGAPTRRR